MNDEILVDLYGRLLHLHGCSVDDILETPEWRREFLMEARRTLGDLPERELLHRLVYLRKRKKLPRICDTPSV